ncbi:M56 family metallopeptidase [Pseudoduganella namucuonensis]|uniref:BlaR1 peptidase M56 n=1 Tax=Pseudoduganella namucuonensis TaxID=1035707 RepID=A0A1I7IH00_9BURK|nr:M56 family metallopeptidase [Pseudoduganella namucuonensis]SFU72237.1 BlaR1 peptidase M56 [Pseudoduganella namucuonensis]
MTAWMIYVVAVTILLSGAALLAEQAVHQRRGPRRWIWALAIVASLLIPTVVSSVSVQMPDLFAPAVSRKIVVLRESASLRLPFVGPAPAGAIGGGEADHARIIKRAWGAASAAIAAGLLISGAIVMRRKRHWRSARMSGADVLVAPDTGPAVVGLLRPRIVVPAWLTQADSTQQELVIAHEQAHLDAFDPQLLSIALCLLILMPWNLPLWWQLHRLRRAIEVDCDARVLRYKRNLADYGATLLAVGQRRSGYLGVAAAMSESASFLEQRIQIMLKKPARWNRGAAATLACLSLLTAAIAAQIMPPNALKAPSEGQSLGPAAIGNYLGSYRVAGDHLISVTGDGARLLAQLPGQGPLEMVPAGDAEFTIPALKMSISAIRDGQGRATALVLHVQGQEELTARRIDAALAEQIKDGLARKVALQVATQGTETALRRLFAQLNETPMKLDGIGPELAAAIRRQEPVMRAHLNRLGDVRSVEFIGVATNGADKYLVRYEHGTAQWLISLDEQGVVLTAFVGP